MIKYNIISFSYFDSLTLIVGGLSLFLFGLNLLKDNLKNLSDKKMKSLLHISTSSNILAFTTGFFATILVQSSSGVTAIVISLIATDYLDLKRGLGIMIGSNVGTCTTAFLISLNIEKYALLIIIIASILCFIFKNPQKQMFAQSFLALGIVFLGLFLMTSGFDYIASSTTFLLTIIKTSNNVLISCIFGSLLTALIQSSSATIGILEQLYESQIISILPAIAIMLGSNIGTTTTGYLSAFNTPRVAKQAITGNLIFNIIGTILFLIIIKPFSLLLLSLETKFFVSNLNLTIAMAHLIFNLSTALLLLIFFNPYVNLIKKI